MIPTPSDTPRWLADLLGRVEAAFELTGADTPGWPDPHPDRDPLEDEYSRCLDPDKYRIVGARVDAWLAALGVTVTDEPPRPWEGAVRQPTGWTRVRRAELTGTAALVIADTIGDRAPFGIDLGLAVGPARTRFVVTLPRCGCDACDDGSTVLLDEVDHEVLTILRRFPAYQGRWQSPGDSQTPR